MAVIIKNSNITDITATGYLVSIENNVISVEDDKTGLQELDLNDVLGLFKDKEIKLKITNKECAIKEES
jgi:hypothetical protein